MEHDDDEIAHWGGYCEGYPMCWWCFDVDEQDRELEYDEEDE